MAMTFSKGAVEVGEMQRTNLLYHIVLTLSHHTLPVDTLLVPCYNFLNLSRKGNDGEEWRCIFSSEPGAGVSPVNKTPGPPRMPHAEIFTKKRVSDSRSAPVKGLKRAMRHCLLSQLGWYRELNSRPLVRAGFFISTLTA